MNPDEVIDHVIKKLQSLDQKDRNSLVFYISCLNHSIDSFDKDVFSEALTILEFLGVDCMEVEEYGVTTYRLVPQHEDGDEEE